MLERSKIPCLLESLPSQLGPTMLWTLILIFSYSTGEEKIPFRQFLFQNSCIVEYINEDASPIIIILTLSIYHILPIYTSFYIYMLKTTSNLSGVGPFIEWIIVRKIIFHICMGLCKYNLLSSTSSASSRSTLAKRLRNVVAFREQPCYIFTPTNPLDTLSRISYIWYACSKKLASLLPHCRHFFLLRCFHYFLFQYFWHFVSVTSSTLQIFCFTSSTSPPFSSSTTTFLPFWLCTATHITDILFFFFHISVIIFSTSFHISAILFFLRFYISAILVFFLYASSFSFLLFINYFNVLPLLY